MFFGVDIRVNCGPFVNRETCLCARVMDERLRSLVEKAEGSAGVSGCGSFLAFGDHSCLEMLGFVGVGNVLHLRGCSLFLVFWGDRVWGLQKRRCLVL